MCMRENYKLFCAKDGKRNEISYKIINKRMKILK